MAFIELTLSQARSPDRFSSYAEKDTMPPLDPDMPHLSVAAAFISVPEAEVTFTPLSLITAFVFVTKNTGPNVTEIEPPFIVKSPEPFSASPEKLW